jgi:hypothetical protein
VIDRATLARLCEPGSIHHLDPRATLGRGRPIHHIERRSLTARHVDVLALGQGPLPVSLRGGQGTTWYYSAPTVLRDFHCFVVLFAVVCNSVPDALVSAGLDFQESSPSGEPCLRSQRLRVQIPPGILAR